MEGRAEVKAIRSLLILVLALWLGACATMRPYPGDRGQARGGGDRSWLKRTEPRIPRRGLSAEGREFEQVRLMRWRRVAGLIGLTWPLKKVEVTSRYGWRGEEAHDGIDLRAPVGTPVHAAHEGRVLYAGNGIQGYGNLVVIRHSSGLATVYAHNSRLRVSRGQRVRRGQLIALSGSTGRSSGPHVHFEVRAGSRPLNPLDLLGRGRSGGQSVALLD